MRWTSSLGRFTDQESWSIVGRLTETRHSPLCIGPHYQMGWVFALWMRRLASFSRWRNSGMEDGMAEQQRIVGAVFARGGSKGVPRKCLRRVGGRTLLEIAVSDALQVDRLERIVVSTDDAEYAAAAEAAGAEVPFLRPTELASDTAAEVDSWRHLISFLDQDGVRPDILVTLPATAPLRNPSDVDDALDLFLRVRADLVVTGTPAARHPSFNMVAVDDEGWAAIASPVQGGLVRRQDAPQLWDLATVTFVADTTYVETTRHLFDGRVALSPVPRERAIDIDDEFDLVVADLLASSGRL
ncbi:MAG: acylneuraminate cytidylyltransferase [Acidimicrobiaceae bacterium]|nr:acylneuraminate cytidylyltransferase [Acidimicrobiaceae bacterium]